MMIWCATPRAACGAVCAFPDLPSHPAVLGPYDARRERMVEAASNDPKLRDHGRIDVGLADAWRRDGAIRSCDGGHRRTLEGIYGDKLKLRTHALVCIGLVRFVW
jgi:hypothetical protein